MKSSQGLHEYDRRRGPTTPRGNLSTSGTRSSRNHCASHDSNPFITELLVCLTIQLVNVSVCVCVSLAESLWIATFTVWECQRGRGCLKGLHNKHNNKSGTQFLFFAKWLNHFTEMLTLTLILNNCLLWWDNVVGLCRTSVMEETGRKADRQREREKQTGTCTQTDRQPPLWLNRAAQ